jgi:hypothetical protein
MALALSIVMPHPVLLVFNAYSLDNPTNTTRKAGLLLNYVSFINSVATLKQK